MLGCLPIVKLVNSGCMLTKQEKRQYERSLMYKHNLVVLEDGENAGDSEEVGVEDSEKTNQVLL